MLVRSIFALLVFSLLSVAQTQADVVAYDEAASGDLSGVFTLPDPIALTPGDGNLILGQVGLNGNTGATNDNDADYFTFTLTGASQITSITIEQYTFSPSDPGVSFMGYVAGNAFAGQGMGDIDGSVLFNASSGEVLDDIGVTIGAGDHSFWIQETSTNVANYTIRFAVSSVPEPTSAIVLFALSLATIFSRRRRIV